MAPKAWGENPKTFILTRRGTGNPFSFKDPDGDGVDEGGSVPGAPSFTLSSNSSSITATITDAAGATSYECRVDGGSWVSGLTVSGLNASQTYTFEVRGINANGTGPATSDSVTTSAAGSVTPFFEDSFESGDTSTSYNGFSWNGNVGVEAGAGRGGSNALRFDFTNGSSTEQSFKLTQTVGTGYTELWIEYWWYIPTNIQLNYEFTGNKFNAFWAESYSQDVQSVTEFWWKSSYPPDQAYIRTVCTSGTGCDNSNNYTIKDDLVRPEWVGTWVRIREHLKVGDGDGAVEIWANDTKVYENLNYEMWFTGGNNYFRNGYLMGSSSNNWVELTTFYIDEIKFYDQDPGWGLT